MGSLTPFLTVAGSADETLRRLRQPLDRAGLRVLRTFDLKDARLAAADCPCPHHGEAGCECQMVVLLIYGEAAPPVTLILHGSQGWTWLSLGDTAARETHALIRLSIERALQINPSQ